MRILALDTTTRSGSVALIDRNTVVAAEPGDPARTHGERLPTDIIRLLTACHVSLADIDVFAVAAGPGSFTGLRIGIATMQGLAAANRKGLIGLSALDALALGARPQVGGGGDAADFLAAWMDAQRGEVFAALYNPNLSLCDGPLVASPEEILSRWASKIPHTWFIGDGAIRYRGLIARDRVVEPTPLIAPAIGLMAAGRVETVPPPSPDAIRPLYVRRPDAELARDRHRVQADR